MENLNGKWTIGKNEESFYEYEYFDTKEEAIEFGKEYDGFDGKGFYVGQIESIPMCAGSLGVQVIEFIQTVHADNDGEYGQDYLDDVKREHIEELDKMIEKAVLEWATKYDYHPKHFFVINIEFIESDKREVEIENT